jgi:DNA anti-recombination protein RmuC
MENTQTILIAIVGITGISVFLQFIVLLAMQLTLRKGIKSATEFSEEMKLTVAPVIEQSKALIKSSCEVVAATRDLVTRLEPRLDAAAIDLAAMTRSAREQAQHIEASAEEIMERARRQAERIDAITTEALNSVERLAHFVAESVIVPVRQVNGIIAAAKAIVATLRKPLPPRRRTPAEDRARDESGQFV